jgi:hypothetical protein
MAAGGRREPRGPQLGRRRRQRGRRRHQCLRRDSAGRCSGQRAGGGHTKAVDLLNGADDDGRQAARQVSQLLRYKTPAEHDPAPMPEGYATKAVAPARPLVDRAAEVNTRRRPSG